MRKIIALLTILSFNAYAVAPTGIGGEQGTLSYTNNLKAPNYQITSLGGVNSRIESGNTNLLINPSFEHPTVGTGWTTANATASADITNQVDGKKTLSLSVTGAMLVSQDSTVNAANLTGLQGVASVKIKATGTTGLKVCPRNAGAAVTGLCVNVTADNTWKHVSIPFILGATSNGIGIATTATGGTVIIDDAFVGTSAPFQDVGGAKLVGSVVITGCTSFWTVTSTTFVSPAAQTGCVYTTSGSAVADASFGTAQLPSIKLASLPPGDYRIEYEGFWGTVTSGAQTACAQFTDGTNVARETSCLVSGGGASTVQLPGISQTISYSTAQTNVTLTPKLKATSSSVTMYGTTTQPGTIKLYYFPPASKIYSQASQDYDWTAYTPTFTSLGAVTITEAFHKRANGNLYIKGRATLGTTVGTAASIGLPSSLTISSTASTTTSTITGALVNNSNVGNYAPLITGGENAVFFGNVTTPAGLSKAIGTNIGSSSQVIAWSIGPIPISGWQDYGVIVGSFAGIEKCANDYECTDTFSADVSAAGVVSNENIDWLNGNCSLASSTFTCTYNTNLKDGVSALSSAMNCKATVKGTSPQDIVVNTASTSTGSTWATYESTVGTVLARSFSISCQKGTQDYKPKTAKVASSIGVPTVPGITTQAIDTFSVSYGATATTVCSASSTACAYLDQIGTAVSNITRGASAGLYTLNTIKTYTKLKCTSTLMLSSGSPGNGSDLNCASTSSCSFVTGTSGIGTRADVYGTLICQGTY